MYSGNMYTRKTRLPQNQSFFLFGPRGTGKTTWLRYQYPGAVFIDLLEARTFNELAADPQRLENRLISDKEYPIIIDEIQKLPGLLDEVHRLIETHGHWFILTGSSARKVRRSGVNLLGGRALTKYFHPLTADEMGADFDLTSALKWGLLPSIYDPSKEISPDEYLQSYVQTYLKEEVQQEGLTRNLTSFARFLEAASFSQGESLNITEVARECQIKRKLAESYFDILEDLLLAVRIPVFTKRARRRVTRHPRFYYFDPGVFRSLRPTGPLDAAAEIEGPSIETLVLLHLRAISSRCDPNAEICYWRTATGLEVDFVVYSENVFAAIELKRKKSIYRTDIRGLQTFGEDYPEAKRFVFYGGDYEQTVKGTCVVPLKDALPRLQALLWPNR